jgi:hypothetical protein
LDLIELPRWIEYSRATKNQHRLPHYVTSRCLSTR